MLWTHGIKLEISNRRKTGKFRSMLNLNNMFLNNQWAKEEITREIRKYFETNENENTIYQNLWEAAKTMLQEKSIAVNVYIKRDKMF